MNRTINGVMCFLLLTLAFCASAGAAPVTWNNANLTGNWNTDSNWVGGIKPSTVNGPSTDNVSVDGETGTNVVTTLNATFWMDTLNVSAGDSIVGAGGLRFTGSANTWNNAGTISATTGQIDLQSGGTGVTNINSGVIQADGGQMQLAGTAGYDITNTGGTFQAINGGQLRLRTRLITVTGGMLNIDATSSLVGNDVQPVFDFVNTTSTNSGTILWDQNGGGSTRTKTLTFSGAGSFVNNASGTINLLSNQLIDNASWTLEFRVEDTTSFTNDGTFNITNDAQGIFSGSGQSAIFRIDASAAPSFANNGSINITHTASNVGHVAQMVSGGSLTNAGDISIDGAGASIQMPGNDFTQTAGSLAFANDGSITASNVIINGGVISGTGTINGNLELNDTMNLQIGSGGDLLTVNGNLSLDDITSVLDLDLGSGGIVDGAVLVNYTGTLSGRFGSVSGLPMGYEIGYGSGLNSSITVNFVPEPSSLMLMSLGLCGVRIRRRRRKVAACRA